MDLMRASFSVKWSIGTEGLIYIKPRVQSWKRVEVAALLFVPHDRIVVAHMQESYSGHGGLTSLLAVLAAVRTKHVSFTEGDGSAIGVSLWRYLSAMINFTLYWFVACKMKRGVDAGKHVSVKLPCILACVITVLLVPRCQPCYVYPPDVQDPCKDKTCSFGAQCVPSLDGGTARCQCPERCDTYGDSKGSMPVCGTDGRDYANQCEMKKAACHDMQDIRIKYPGKCGKSSFSYQLLPSTWLTACYCKLKYTLLFFHHRHVM